MKVKEYCKCGGQMTGRMSPDYKAEEVIKIFWQIHSGQEHEKVTPSQCYSARRKAEVEEKI